MGKFVYDYEPKKGIEIEQLDGCINLFTERLVDMATDGEAGFEIYLGAMIALELIRHGEFNRPKDFLAVFENRVNEIDS